MLAAGWAAAVSAEVVTIQNVRENTLATLQPEVTFTDNPNGVARGHLKMDLIRPVSAAPTPAIVFVSGNAWRSVDRAALIPQLAPLAEADYLVAANEYRIIGEATFPEPLKDVKTAIRFLRPTPSATTSTPTAPVSGGAPRAGSSPAWWERRATCPSSGATNGRATPAPSRPS